MYGTSCIGEAHDAVSDMPSCTVSTVNREASSSAKWHECSHSTAFKSNWPNEIFYFLCGAMEFRDYMDFRWSHAWHHSYTIMTGVDPEIAVSRPPKLVFVFLDFFYLKSGFMDVRKLLLHSLGIVPKSVGV
jgi:fatty acid desaturase